MSATRITHALGMVHGVYKGPGAAAAITALGFALPARPNSWAIHETGLVARLGVGEYLIQSRSPLVGLTETALPPGVYAVPRRDEVFLIQGPQLFELLAELSSFEFRQMAWDDVALTQIAGVSVIAAPFRNPSGVLLWVDPSYAEDLQAMVAAVAAELEARQPSN